MVSSETNRSRVLVVDDEPAICRLIALVLQEEGYEVTAAPSGKVALAEAAAALPAIVLLDLMMPEMSGQETLARLRELPGGGGVPVIIMSAAVVMAEQIEGVQGILTKPFDLSDLVLSVDRIVDRPNRGTPSRHLMRER
ncbi:MAG: response regulator [Thermomicrobiales bacterium]